jgi:hypothetical protein
LQRLEAQALRAWSQGIDPMRSNKSDLQQQDLVAARSWVRFEFAKKKDPRKRRSFECWWAVKDLNLRPID